MKSNKLVVTGLLLFSVACIAVPTMAGDTGKKCDMKHHAANWGEHERLGGRDFRHLSNALELTEAQKETLKTQRDANKSARDVLHAQLKGTREALTAAVNAGANDSELNALTETLGRLHAEQALAGAKAQKAFLAVLTDEQKQAMADLKTRRLERKIERKEKRESAKS